MDVLLRNPVREVYTTEGDPIGDIPDPGEEDEKKALNRPPMEIVWWNIMMFAGLHGGALIGLFLLPISSFYTFLWALLLHAVSGVGITAGAHRLWAHRTYKARLPLRIFLAFAHTVAVQNDLIEWSRDHRVHHKYSETDADPHNAKRGFFFAHMGWLLCRKHPDVKMKGGKLSMDDLKADPVLRFQERFYKPLVVLCSFIMPTVVPYYLWNESIIKAYFIACLLRLVVSLHTTWLVNSAAHLYGNRPYDKRINPRENLVVSALAIGEGFHNYHHTFPMDYRTSEYGWDYNWTARFIDLMATIGMVTDRKIIPQEVIDKRKLRTGDGTESLEES